MKGTFNGYDPELGQKFLAESGGFVIGRAKSSPKKSEAQAIEEYSREHRRAPDVQQLHDWMTSQPSAPESQEENEEDSKAERLAGQKKMMGRAVQNVQMQARSMGVALGALSANKILEMAASGKLPEMSSVEALRKMVKQMGG